MRRKSKYIVIQDMQLQNCKRLFAIDQSRTWFASGQCAKCIDRRFRDYGWRGCRRLTTWVLVSSARPLILTSRRDYQTRISRYPDQSKMYLQLTFLLTFRDCSSNLRVLLRAFFTLWWINIWWFLIFALD